MAFRVVVPARHGASRLPGKPLMEIAGRPMLQHVCERAGESGAATVLVATDDARIREAAAGFGAEVCMTAPDHASGTERLAEVAAMQGWGPDEVVVNLQGDEPLMPASLIRQVAEDLQAHAGADVATLATPIRTAAELFDPHAVKVVTDRNGYALLFSRAPVPWDRDAFAVTTERLPEDGAHPHFRHLGLYAYRAGFLQEYAGLEPSPLEGMESLEQLRVLWHGRRIHVAVAAELPGPGVDTAEDLERVRQILTD
ncbi:MAG TPA: 3-deoxy-manno-octulosonate cytidylyltransferase [Gammaproteobacteria bacterium]|nr:3-deoxy-manno-octulosonate cytidylyltransferase [Gammaproteobacteria bacterium]